MPMTPAQVFAVIAPQYGTDPRAVWAMELAVEQIPLDHCFYGSAVANLAAHMMAVGDRAGVGGAVTGRSEGALSISFSSEVASGLLGGTAYGQELMRLNRLCYGITARTGWIDDLGTAVVWP